MTKRFEKAALIFDKVQLDRSLIDVAIRLDKSSIGQPIDTRDASLDLLAWGRRYLPHYFRSEPSAMHRALAARLAEAEQARGAKLNVVGPRGGAKSTVGTLAWLLRSVVTKREPYVWIVSDTRHQAANHLENIKHELLDNAQLAADYPQACGRGPRWRSHVIELRNGTVVEAFGTGVRMRGRRRGEHRPTLIICDDLQNDSHIESARQRELSSRWFHGTLLKAGTRKTNILNLATALHRDALALELHRTPGWQSEIFAAVRRWPDAMELWDRWEAIYADLNDADARGNARRFYDAHRAAMDAGAELLWPDQEDLYALMCMRVEGGRAAFEREKQGSPLNPELCEWPEEYFTHDEFWFDRWPEDLIVRTMALDPSKGADARHGDYSAIVLLGLDAAGRIYIEADLARRPTPQMVADCCTWHAQFRPDAFAVEANHFQELLGDELVREARQRGRHDFAPWSITNNAPKKVRIRRLAPLLAQRRLAFRSGSPGTRLLVNQLRDFPCADHDDGPDALEMAYRLAMELLEER
jgi:predicted phage terminase large subunit-like protein